MTHTWLLALNLIAAPAAAQDAAALLAKAVNAFENNQQNEKHWNWSIVETRHIEDRSGKTVETFPSVTSESVIRTNGRRCNALNEWGDGLEPYMKGAEPDQRCQAFNALSTPFQVPLLLSSTQAKIVARTGSAIRIAIQPDPSKSKSAAYEVRCAATLKATVELDPATYFPMSIEGEVAGTGCNGSFQPVIHYSSYDRRPMISQFRKGATFRIVYQRQEDKFGNPANSYWISTIQHYVQPWDSDSRLLFYWGRQISVRNTTGRHMVKEVKTTAQEFGAGSQLIFK
ncbi:MAG: hypothetical protein ABI806_19365 [Candidatus Solibacter sp.]